MIREYTVLYIKTLLESIWRFTNWLAHSKSSKWYDCKPACLRRVFRSFGDMEVRFTPEQEARLAQLANKEGTDTEHLVKDAALRLLKDETSFPEAAPELPVWHLGAAGAFHRRDIYDDIR